MLNHSLKSVHSYHVVLEALLYVFAYINMLPYFMYARNEGSDKTRGHINGFVFHHLIIEVLHLILK